MTNRQKSEKAEKGMTKRRIDEEMDRHKNINYKTLDSLLKVLKSCSSVKIFVYCIILA